MSKQGSVKGFAVHGQALDVRLAGGSDGGDHERPGGIGEVDGHFIKERPARIFSMSRSERKSSVRLRSDNIGSVNRGNRVKPKRAEDVPRAHLPTILVLSDEYVDKRLAEISRMKNVPQRVHPLCCYSLPVRPAGCALETWMRPQQANTGTGCGGKAGRASVVNEMSTQI